jgi:aquaporin Z
LSPSSGNTLIHYTGGYQCRQFGSPFFDTLIMPTKSREPSAFGEHDDFGCSAITRRWLKMVTNAVRKYSAELIGTFALVLIGVGSAVIAGEAIGQTGVAFAFGLILLTMVYAIGGISGCHINPAVTVGMLVTGNTKLRDGIAYIIVQCIGAILGAGLILAIAMGTPGYSLAVDGLGQNGYGDQSPGSYSLESCFIAEVAVTALFVFVVLGSLGKEAPKGFAGLAIGFALLFAHLIQIPITNASVNPARSLGPAVFVGGAALAQLWLFWVAPIIGAIIAALIWRYLLEAR